MPVTDKSFNPSKNPVIDNIKTLTLRMEEYIVSAIPEGRRRSVALTKLEDFAMWAVKAAAVGDK